MLGDISRIKYGEREIKVTDELMALVASRQGCEVASSVMVMIHHSCRFGKRNSHNIARSSGDGRWYVRKGKRGGIVCFLTTCQITIIDGQAALYQFKTDQV